MDRFSGGECGPRSGSLAPTDNPELGIRRDYVRDEYRVLFIGSHGVYYTVNTHNHPRHPCPACAHGPGAASAIGEDLRTITTK